MTEGLTFPQITPPDGTARASALTLRGADDTVSSPAGPLGLGRLATAAGWLAGCQAASPPRAISRAVLVVTAAEVPSALTELADSAGASLRVIDDLPASRPIDVEDALTDDEVEAALRAGIDAADREVDAGADLLVAANLGADSTTAAAVLVAALTGAEPVAVTGRGSGIDDAAWMRKATAVRDALRRAKPHIAEPVALLRASGGADLAALAGLLLQAAARRTPVLLAGLSTTAAAVVAEELAPGAREWWLAPSTTTEPAHDLACEHLDLVPLLDLRLGGDAEAAGLLTVPLLAAAVRALGAA